MTTAQQPEIPPPSPDDVLFAKNDGIGRITLNRPVVLNAINWSIRLRLMQALERADADDDVKVIILTGSGRSFCAGGDIQPTPPPDDVEIPGAMEIFLKIWETPKPVIAAVNGHAVGQGCELAGICDLTIAADDAKFGEIQIRHGFGPPILIAPYLLGPKQAKELLMLGEIVDAAEAQRLGLVNRVVPAASLLEEAEKIAAKLVALPQRAVRTNKLLVNRVHELAGLRAAFDYSSDPVVKAVMEATPGDAAMNTHLKVLREQGWEAFRESRDALYKGDADVR
jgi:enoyl-CoA hydratase/carnithine racemase